MLLKKHPSKILGEEVETDFLFWMGIGRTLDSEMFSDFEKIEIVAQSIFDKCPYSQEEALEWHVAVLGFYSCEQEDRGIAPPKEQLIEWEVDSDAIWADFMLWHKIDLEKTRMHWWTFRALFSALPPDSSIKSLIGIRNEDLSNYSGKGQEKIYQAKSEQKRAVAIKPPALWEEE